MEKNVAVLIFGHKAQIESITGYPAPDRILVGLSFDEPVGSTAGFAVLLPVRSYTVAEFLEAVRLEGEKRLQVAIEQDQFRHNEQKLKKDKQDGLNEKVELLKALLGLD